MTPVLPLVACIAVLGLKKLPEWQHKIVTIGAIALIIVNGFMFNTNKIAHEDPQATQYLQALERLPSKACLITPRGGAYGFSIFYQMSKGQELIPLALSDISKWREEQDGAYIDYTKWLKREYGIEGDNIYEITNDALDKDYPVYFAAPMTKLWDAAFTYEEYGLGHYMFEESKQTDYLQRVTGVLENPEFPTTVIEIEGFWSNFNFGKIWQLRQTVAGEDEQ
jgi:hypothetical protein